MFHPELSRSFIPIRESGRALAEIWAAARENLLRRGRGERQGRLPIGVMEWLVVIGMVVCVSYGVAVFFGGLLLAAVPKSNAQVADSGIVAGADEKTRELLHFLHDVGGGTGFGLGEMLRYFNAAVLVVVAVVLIYQVLYAVVETGRTGEANLTGWQVMRLVIGMGLIFPLPATGLGPGQHLFLSLTDVSGNVAAGVWNRVATAIATGGPAGPVRVPPRYRGVVVNMIIVHTCMYVHNRIAEQGGDGPYIIVKKTTGAKAVSYLYGDPVNPRYRACGQVTIAVESTADNPAAGIMTSAHLNTLQSSEFVAGLDRAAKDLGDRFISASSEFGASLPEVNGWLDGTGLVSRYSDAVADHVTRAAEESRESLTKELAEAIAREGWMSAATFLMVISRNHAMLHDAMRAIPAVSLGSAFAENADLEKVGPWKDMEATLSAWLTRSEVAEMSAQLTPAHEEGWWSALVNIIPVESVAYLDDGSPLEALVGMGHKLIDSAMAVLAVKTGASFVGWLGRKVGKLVAKEIFSGAIALVNAITYVMLFAGITLAYILPLVPFLRFFFGIVSWVVSVVAGLIAIPLYLALQMGGEARGLVGGTTRGGLLLVLHAIARPALMVFGLVFGYFIFVAAMELFNWLFVAHLRGISNSSEIGVLTTIVSFLIYAVVAFALANAAFKAIDVVPQEVIRWLGGRVSAGEDEIAGLGRAAGEAVTVASALRGAGRLPKAR